MQVKVKDWNINYEVRGEGEPVVFFHGWLNDLEAMRPLSINLAKKHKVYLVDVVGFGKSDLPKEPLNSNDFGEFVQGFLDALNIKNPTLIGHSNGGRCIINAVGRNLVKPSKIVLISSGGIVPKRGLKYKIKIGIVKTAKSIIKILPNSEELEKKLKNKVGSSDYKASPEVMKDTLKVIVNEDLRELLPNIKVPTLLIWGGLDTATPISDAKLMESLIPDAGLVEYPYGTHFAYLENLENCKAVLDSFLG